MRTHVVQEDQMPAPCRLAVLVALPLIALASAAFGQSNEIRACVWQNGQVQIIGAGEVCKPNQTLQTWNIQGPKGDKGDPGDKGDKGDRGEPGAGLETG